VDQEWGSWECSGRERGRGRGALRSQTVIVQWLQRKGCGYFVGRETESSSRIFDEGADIENLLRTKEFLSRVQ